MMAQPYTNGSCACFTCSGRSNAATTALFWPLFDVADVDFVELTTPPTEHILREQADRERSEQQRARARARRALRVVAGRRAPEVSAALSMRAIAMRHAA